MSSSALISTLPSPLPSPTPSIRPSKLELLRLLREQRERGQQLGAAQADSTQTTPAASSVPSTSDSNSLLPSSTPDTSEGSKLNMGAVLGGLAGGVLLLAIILVAIIVPLQRRRSLRNAVTGVPGKAAKTRRRINLNLPWSFGSGGGGEKDEEAVGGEGQGEKDKEGLIEGRKTYPTVRSGAGTHRTTGSEVPLLGRNGGGSGDYTPTRSAFGERGGGQVRLDHPQEARHPAQSSTHLYEDLPLASPTEQGATQSSRQNQIQPGKHDDLWFYYRTNSTAAPPVSNTGTVKSGTEQASAHGIRSDFDPYSPFAGTPSPLDDISRGNAKTSGTFADLERPAPAAAPSSPKKVIRDLPLPDTSPFVDVELNDITSPTVAEVATINSQKFGTGKSSVNIYTCIDNPFMTPLERNQIKPPIPVATTAVGSTRGGAVHGGGSWFSYHSSSVRSGPHIRTAPLPPTFVPPITTSPTDLRDPTRQPSPDSSEPDSASVYSQMSLSRSATAMSVNGSIIRYGSARAQAAENGGSGFMPVVLETKEDTPVKPHFPRDASTAEGLATTVTPASPSTSVEDDDPTPKATPATSTNTKTTLARMDTLAIGNLIKGRAKRVAVKRSNSDVERIEREGSVAESEGGSDIRRDVATVQQVTKELAKIAAQSTDREEDVVVRGRGVRREEVEEAVAYGAIPRAPVKRTSSDQALGRSRSRSRGRLVPKASLQRTRAASSDEGGAGVGNEEDGRSPAKPLIGRSPSKYRPKGLQQRLVEKGLLNMGGASGGRSRSASRNENERRVRARTTSVPTPPVNIGAKAIEVKKRVEVVVSGRDDGDVSSSAASTPSPSPAKSKGKNKNKKNLLIREPPPSDIDSTLLSLPQERTKASEATESFAANPLTGAFGLGQPPAVRSPATPTFQYAFAELDRVKGFLPKVEGLNVGGSGGKKKGGK